MAEKVKNVALDVLLNVTDTKGNRLSYNGKDITLTLSDGSSRNIGFIHEEDGLTYYRKHEKEADRYRRLDAWSIAATVLNAVDIVQYQSDKRAYQIDARKASLYGKLQREKVDLEEKVYVPVKAWDIFKSYDATEAKRIGMFGVEWYNVLHDLIWSDYMNSISFFLAERNKVAKIYPPLPNLFDAYAATPLSKVRVVVMGNHPVMDSCTSGLAFGYELPFGQMPEIAHIQHELERERCDGLIDGKDTVFRSSDWTDQGVMCLNASLSIERGSITHEGQWDTLVERTLRSIQAKGTQVVFLLLGTWAHRYARLIDKGFHHVITADAYDMNFIGSDVFCKCNDKLKEWGQPVINW